MLLRRRRVPFERHGNLHLALALGVGQTIWQWGLSTVPLGLARRALLYRANRKEADVILRPGFVPPNRVARLLLHALKNIETSLPFPMPLGTSILAWGRLRTSAPPAVPGYNWSLLDNFSINTAILKLAPVASQETAQPPG
jgi:hypothetical protein